MSDRRSVSVAMATYNGEKYIKEQIESICRQLADEDEIVISDDGSNDGTIDVIRGLQRTDSRILLIDGPKKGISSNFENAISNCKNEIIFLSDQDDVWFPDKVEKTLFAFDKSRCSLVMHRALIMDDIRETEQLMVNYRRGFANNLLQSSYWGCCMAFTSEFISRYLPFRTNVVAHDQLIGLLSEKISGTYFLNEPLIYHRLHSENATKRRGLLQKIDFRRRLFLNYYHISRNCKKLSRES